MGYDHVSSEVLQYFKMEQIKKLCRKEQLADFEDLTAELSRIFSRPPRPRHNE